MHVLNFIDIDDCSPNPCQNNGVCTDGVNTYTCDCGTGYEGRNCDNSKKYYLAHPCMYVDNQLIY